MPPKKAAPAKAAPAKAAPKTAASAGAKRGRSASAAPAAPAAKSARVAGIAPPPLDEYCTSFKGTVCTDPVTGVPWAVKLNQTNIGENNNKYYIIQLVEGPASRFACFTRWGRVGEPGANATATGDRSAMEKVFAQKFKDKTKNDWALVKEDHSKFKKADGKYDLVETDTSASAAVAPQTAAAVPHAPSAFKASALPAKLQQVLETIFSKDMFNAKMKEKNIDANRMPLGKLTDAQVQRGYETLEEIKKLVSQTKSTSQTASELQTLSSRFYTIIPHDFGRAVPPVINTASMLEGKFDLLNMLSDIQIAVALDESAGKRKTKEENPLDVQYKALCCKMDVVAEKAQEFKLVEEYVHQAEGSSSRKVHAVYRIDRPDDKQRMQAHHSKEAKNRFLLWHGTNIAVVAAILKSGLRIMPHSGGRVGKGLYFANDFSKSDGYTCGHNGKQLMFLVEVCMGDNIHYITKDDCTLTCQKMDQLKTTSTLALGRMDPDPAKAFTIKGEWGDIAVPRGKSIAPPAHKSSSFSQSEFVVYEESRARIKYVVEVASR